MKEIKISSQVWSAENLNIEVFQNGEMIPQAKSNAEWKRAGENGEPAWCYYNNEDKNGEKFGKLYNWYAVNDPRGLAPKGWRIPNSNDWEHAIAILGGESIAGGKLKNNDAGNWLEVIKASSNISGFSGYPNGYRDEYGNFDLLGNNGFWWSVNVYKETEMAFCLKVTANYTGAYYGTIKKVFGLAIRLIKI
jgi:uncharacterized protein (TIGR02145 family)